MTTKLAQKCCKLLDGVLKVHIGRLSAKDMRTNTLEWDRRMQISILIWAKSTLMSILTWGSNMPMSTLVLVRLTQTSTDANHRELNRSFFVYMPPTASVRAVHVEAHSERRLLARFACVCVESLYRVYRNRYICGSLNPAFDGAV